MKTKRTITLDEGGGHEFISGAGKEMRRLVEQCISNRIVPLQIQIRNLNREFAELQLAVDMLYKQQQPDLPEFESEDKMNGSLEKNTEEIVLKTTTLLADCVEQLSKESVPARSTYITAKIATCLEILKLLAGNRF